MENNFQYNLLAYFSFTLSYVLLPLLALVLLDYLHIMKYQSCVCIENLHMGTFNVNYSKNIKMLFLSIIH